MTKHRVAWHEAGHAVVGRHLGMAVTRVGIWQAKHKRLDGSTFKMWEGETQGNYNSLSPHDQRVVSVAGAMAVYCWYEEAEGPPADNYLDFDSVAGLMSTLDWTINDVAHNPSTMSDAEEALWYKAMDQAYSLLNPKTGPLWRELKSEANKIRRQRFVTTFNKSFKIREAAA
jgi:hypothetical protein